MFSEKVEITLTCAHIHARVRTHAHARTLMYVCTRACVNSWCGMISIIDVETYVVVVVLSLLLLRNEVPWFGSFRRFYCIRVVRTTHKRAHERVVVNNLRVITK